MLKQKVFVFDAYVEVKDEKYYNDLGLDDSDLFAYHNQLLDKDGYVKPDDFHNHLKPMKPLMRNVVVKFKYELDKKEKKYLRTLNNKIDLISKVLKNFKKEKHTFEQAVLQKILDESDYEYIYEGEDWECNLSPLGRCIYTDQNGEPECIFCGEPEERK